MEYITIKEYAHKQGITIQAVYQQINRRINKDFIKQHSKIVKGIKYLDSEAVKYLENKRELSPTVNVTDGNNERILELEMAIGKLKNERIFDMKTIIKLQNEKMEYQRIANQSKINHEKFLLTQKNLEKEMKDKLYLEEEIKSLKDEIKTIKQAGLMSRIFQKW